MAASATMIAMMTCLIRLAAGGQLLMNYGFRHVPASTGAQMAMLTPALSAAAGVGLFHEPLHPVSGLGMAVILISTVAAARLRCSEAVPSPAPPAPAPAASSGR